LTNSFTRWYGTWIPYAKSRWLRPIGSSGKSGAPSDYPGRRRCFRYRLIFICHALKHHHIGLEDIADGIWSIYSGSVLLGRLDERDFIIRD